MKETSDSSNDPSGLTPGERENLLAEALEKIIHSTPLGICITNEEGYFEAVNHSYAKFYGYSEEELIGEHFTLVVPEETKEELTCLHSRFMADGEEESDEWLVVTKSGEMKTIRITATRIVGNDGRRKKVTFITDVSVQKAAEEKLRAVNLKLREAARTDSLTGLHNHGTIMALLNQEIKRASRYFFPLSIALLDIDHFKQVNDNHGHVTGDEVLVEVAEALRNTMRAEDSIGRYGGEEFLIVMPHSIASSARLVIERLRKQIERLRFSSQCVCITISGGVAEHDSQSAVELVHEADQLLYEAKATGRNRVVSPGHR